MLTSVSGETIVFAFCWLFSFNKCLDIGVSLFWWNEEDSSERFLLIDKLI